MGRRLTAVLQIASSVDLKELLALDVQRPYQFILRSGGRQLAGGVFTSPLGDEFWRNVVTAMREATEASDANALRRQLEVVKEAGRILHRHLSELAPELHEFLVRETGPRRLVIESQRPEIHLLPWEAMVDPQWRSLAESDISVVHGTDPFDEEPEVADVPLVVEGIFGPGTERRTLQPLRDLQEKAARQRKPRLIVTTPKDGDRQPAGGADLPGTLRDT